MKIIPSEIEKYCIKVGDEIHIEVDLDDKDVVFRFVRGKYEMYGSTAVYLNGEEINELLVLNGIMGENGAVKRILENPRLQKGDEIHYLIYTTVAKYVLQMLNAVMGKVYFPEIKPLAKHAVIYFKSSEEATS